jgi:hypothetical protein
MNVTAFADPDSVVSSDYGGRHVHQTERAQAERRLDQEVVGLERKLHVNVALAQAAQRA